MPIKEKGPSCSSAQKENQQPKFYKGECRRQPQSEPVDIVAVVAGDSVELYTSGRVRLSVVQRPHVDTVAGEIATDCYIEAVLPGWAKGVFRPVNRIATLYPERVSPVELACRHITAEAVRTIQKLTEQPTDGERIVCIW